MPVQSQSCDPGASCAEHSQVCPTPHSSQLAAALVKNPSPNTALTLSTPWAGSCQVHHSGAAPLGEKQQHSQLGRALLIPGNSARLPTVTPLETGCYLVSWCQTQLGMGHHTATPLHWGGTTGNRAEQGTIHGINPLLSCCRILSEAEQHPRCVCIPSHHQGKVKQ